MSGLINHISDLTVGHVISLPIYIRNVLARDKIVVECDSTIQAECPINTKGDLTITSRNETPPTLLLISTTDNPCIGPMCFEENEKWEPSLDTLDTLTIDNVNVICTPHVTNFSLGAYGTDNVPKIILLNGATIKCPEYDDEGLHSRYMINASEVYYDSDGPYTIKPEYALDIDPATAVNSSMKSAFEECRKAGMTEQEISRFNYDWNSRDIKAVAYFYKLDKSFYNIAFNRRHTRRMFEYLSCALIGIPLNDDLDTILDDEDDTDALNNMLYAYKYHVAFKKLYNKESEYDESDIFDKKKSLTAIHKKYRKLKDKIYEKNHKCDVEWWKQLIPEKALGKLSGTDEQIVESYYMNSISKFISNIADESYKSITLRELLESSEDYVDLDYIIFYSGDVAAATSKLLIKSGLLKHSIVCRGYATNIRKESDDTITATFCLNKNVSSINGASDQVLRYSIEENPEENPNGDIQQDVTEAADKDANTSNNEVQNDGTNVDEHTPNVISYDEYIKDLGNIIDKSIDNTWFENHTDFITLNKLLSKASEYKNDNTTTFYLGSTEYISIIQGTDKTNYLGYLCDIRESNSVEGKITVTFKSQDTGAYTYVIASPNMYLRMVLNFKLTGEDAPEFPVKFNTYGTKDEFDAGLLNSIGGPNSYTADNVIDIIDPK